MPEERKNPRNAPIDRFVWREGDVRIIKQGRKKPIRKEGRRPEGQEEVRYKPKPS